MALTDTLVEYWEFEEVSGNRTGSHASTVLVDNNTVTQGTGKVGNCADFELDNIEYLTKADDATIGLGADTPFTWCLWVKGETNPGTGIRFLVYKANESGNFPVEYSLRYDYDNSRFRFSVEINNTPTGTTADHNVALTNGVWYFVVAWHDNVADTLNIQVDNGTPSSIAHALGTADFGGSLFIGAEFGGGGPWDGLIDQLGFWKRVLTTQERTDLYNSGNGLSYAALAASSAAPLKRPQAEVLRPFNMTGSRR